MNQKRLLGNSLGSTVYACVLVLPHFSVRNWSSRLVLPTYTSKTPAGKTLVKNSMLAHCEFKTLENCEEVGQAGKCELA
jgi:hypothetical protein